MPKINRQFGPTCSYNLRIVKNLVAQGRVQINQNALEHAYNDFGWGEKQILDVFKRLQQKHFSTSKPSEKISFCWLDYYKGNFDGEEVFTHFYINDENILVINSFHIDR